MKNSITIRQSLLLAFLLFSVGSATLMTSLAYNRSREVLSTEIRQTLESQALTLTQQIQATVYERVKNLQQWRSLDLMQEVKVRDVDKRLSRFLADINNAYLGIYDEVLCSTDEQVVASSNAANIGNSLRATSKWLSLNLQDGEINLARPAISDPTPVVMIRSQLQDAFSAKSIGEIRAYWNWHEILELINHTSASGNKYAVLIDGAGHPLVMSRNLREQFAREKLDLRRLNFSAWPLEATGHGVFSIYDNHFGLGKLLVGHAAVDNYRGLPNLNWSVVVITRVDAAFQPVRNLLITLLVLLVCILLIGGLLASYLATRMAQPLQALTEYSRAVGENIDAAPRMIDGPKEIVELNSSFNNMIEDIKAARDRLVRVSKLAIVGEMSAKLAHEVRTPLGIIRSSAQLLDRQTGLDERGHEMMNFMINECDRINQLVTGLLEGVRPSPPVREQHDLNAIVTHVADLLSAKLEQKDLTLELPIVNSPIVVICDRNQIIQVLLNLLMNAVQILKPGGLIRVTTSTTPSQVSLRVEDDGPGVPFASREAIFEPLVSERDDGIGLGLSIVREIVNMHHGEIKVTESVLGGANFCVTIPVNNLEYQNAAS